MKYTIPLKWEEEFNHDGFLYFLQRVEEMLFHYSSSLYRVPLLNTNSLIEEYCDVAEQVKQDIQKEYQLTKLFEEFLASFQNDIVLKECWGEENISKICKSFGSSSSNGKLETMYYLHSLFGNNIYYNWCVLTMKKYIHTSKEKKKLEQTIRCWLPELISFGYDANYIYIEIKNYLSKNIVLTANSFNEIINIFDFEIKKYKVYFGIPKSMFIFSELLKERLSLNLEDDGNFHEFKIDSRMAIVYFTNVPSLCPNLAANLAFERFNLFLKFYKFVGNKQFIRLNKKAMVIEEETQATNFVMLKQNMYHIADEINFNEIAETSDQLITGILSNAKSEQYGLLSRAIDLHNSALESTDLKSGYLNLWSSIEVLCSNEYSESKLKSVLNILLPILKKDYLSEVISDIEQSLNQNIGEDALKKLLSGVQTIGCNKKKLFYLCLLPEYKQLREESYVLLADFPVLRSRISQFGTLKNTEALSKVVNVYAQRVEWHIYRMYRVRNGIVHSGVFPEYLKDLGQHLHSYSDAILNEFSCKLGGDIPFDSAANVRSDVKFLFNNFEELFVTKQDLTEQIINKIIHPELSRVMECEKHLSE